MLRHRVALEDLGQVERVKESVVTVPRYKQPVVTEFRRDGELEKVLDVIRRSDRVDLKAACGAGKSTRLPREIARGLGMLVVHTIPFHIAASSLASYLMKQSDGGDVVYVDDVNSDMPSSGVAIMSNAHFHERYFCDKFAGKRFVLYMDEVHESDCWTAVLRNIASGLAPVAKLICATANQGPADAMIVHTPGKRSEYTYPAQSPKSWSALEKGKPWSTQTIQDNTWIFIDRHSVRENMAAEYRQAGFDAYVLTARSSVSEYNAVITALKESASIVVVLADYAYRSSITVVGVSRWICSGEVAYATVQDGTPAWAYRPAYSFEVNQALNRGGRVAGDNVQVYRQATTPVMRMCDLEAIEGDAANLLYRMHGYRPPMFLAEYEYFSGKVPADLASALASEAPVRLYPKSSLVDWINGHVAVNRQKDDEKQYRYEMATRTGRYNQPSCYTIAEPPRATSPVLSVRHAVTTLDDEEMDKYAIHSSGRTSPSNDTVYTVATDMDTLSLLEASNFGYAKPKRVAKHVQERRMREEQERKRVDEELAEAKAIEMKKKADEEKELPPLPANTVVRQGSLATLRGDGQARNAIAGADGDFLAVEERVARGMQSDNISRVGEFGRYYYYYGMEKAPVRSGRFLSGLPAVKGFAERDSAFAAVRHLPVPDRIYAIRLLVDQSNDMTARAYGISRLMTELKGRPPDIFQGLHDRDKLVQMLQWVAEQYNDAQVEAQHCLDVLSVYLDKPLTVIPEATSLEQKVMTAMLNKFSECLVQNSTSQVDEYIQKLADRTVRLVSDKGSGRRKLGF